MTTKPPPLPATCLSEHSRYGAPKSHGCINLSPADAKFLFNWSDPPLPEHWHAVATPEKGPFTWVIIEGKTPK